ncbi:MAG: glutathione S-transferase family protein [Pseudomonadota bacterium]
MYTLVIGNRNYSSWSLRAWLYLRASGIDFKTERVALFADDWPASIQKVSPAGRVPVLMHGEHTVWDSLAIVEYLREHEPSALGWPDEPSERAIARSIVAEMHSGFMNIRGELPQNLKREHAIDPESLTEDCRLQIKRINTMWAELRKRHKSKGPWLFGEFSVADVFYAPVALRFSTYGIALVPAAASFIEAVREHPEIVAWIAAARDERESLEFIDELTPVSQAPLILG